MTLTKREKMLLQIGLCLILFCVIFVYLLLPQMEERDTLIAKKEEVEFSYEKKQMLLANITLDKRYEEAANKARENYDYFYGVLNSYTIDGIVNHLLKEYELTVHTLDISDYEDAAMDFEEAKEQPEILVRSTVSLSVSGNYDKILGFMKALNEKSPCLRVDTFSLQKNASDATGSQGMTASFRIYIYGIDIKAEELNTML